ncbi:MAG: carboxymuconolactone decarboxylase family protein [Planctomycetota bacterium]
MGKSPKEVLEDFQSNMPKLQRALPQVTEDFVRRLMADTLKEGALTTKQKELIALGIAICATCDYCIAIHVKKCFEAGATKEEIAEVCGVAILMGGGPALTYSTFVAKAVEEFGKES